MKKDNRNTDEILLEAATQWVGKMNNTQVRQLAIDLLMCGGSEVVGLIDRYLKEKREKNRLDQNDQSGLEEIQPIED